MVTDRKRTVLISGSYRYFLFLWKISKSTSPTRSSTLAIFINSVSIGYSLDIKRKPISAVEIKYPTRKYMGSNFFPADGLIRYQPKPK